MNPDTAIAEPITARHLPRLLRAGKAIVFPLAAILLWLSLLSFPRQEAIGVDQSWEQSLGYFLKHHFQAGRDYIFTYGPLGYFYTTAYDPDLFWLRYAWELLLKFAMALVLLAIGRRLPNASMQAIFLLVLLLFLGPTLRETRNGLFPLVLLALGLLVPAAPRWSPTLGAALFLLSLLALVKFTLLILAAIEVALLAIHFLLRKHGWFALSILTTFLAFTLLVWVTAGQAIANIPAYLRGSWELTRGFSEAMSLAGDPAQLSLALALLALLGLMLLLLRPEPVRGRRLLVVLLFLAVTFMQWKHGFTRQDDHAAAFFAFTLLAPFLLLAFLTGPTPRRIAGQVLACLCAILSIMGIHWAAKYYFDPDWLIIQWSRRIVEHARATITPWDLRAQLEHDAPMHTRELRLPKIRAIVGTDTIDLLGSMQAILFVNDMTWRPRPVFQSYSTYTPFLLDANARFFASDRAPAYLLAIGSALDERLTSLDDGAALPVILDRYEPVTIERDCTLLRHRPPRRPVPDQLLLDQVIPLGETVRLPASASYYQTLALDIPTTFWGRLRTFFFRAPPIFMRLTTTQGTVHRYRIIPSMIRNGALINPLFSNFQSIFRLYGISRSERAESFSLTIDSPSWPSFLDSFSATVHSSSLPSPPPPRPPATSR